MASALRPACLRDRLAGIDHLAGELAAAGDAHRALGAASAALLAAAAPTCLHDATVAPGYAPAHAMIVVSLLTLRVALRGGGVVAVWPCACAPCWWCCSRERRPGHALCFRARS